MKIKVAERSSLDTVRETKRDKYPEFRNYDPALHPFQQEREYSRALASAKIERLLAKPFIASFFGHDIQIKMMNKHFTDPKMILSVDHDGTAKVWDMEAQTNIYTSNFKNSDKKSSEDFFSCASFSHKNNQMISASKLGHVNFWRFDQKSPIHSIESVMNIENIDHQFDSSIYATCGDKVMLWDENRSSPLQTFNWGPYDTEHVKFNNVQSNILAGCTFDKGIVLYDTKAKSTIRKIILNLESNCLVWNPMEAFKFTVGCSDYNIYTFDMRFLTKPLVVHMDHIAPINSLDYDPTGHRFVSGSDDKTVRIFNANEGRSHEIYHTKRMRQIDAVCWSTDNKYIISGSRDSNLRLWRPKASDNDKILTPREKASRDYANSLKESFESHPEVGKILKFRHVPKKVYNEKKHMENMRRAEKKKAFNRFKNSNNQKMANEKESHVEEVKE